MVLSSSSQLCDLGKEIALSESLFLPINRGNSLGDGNVARLVDRVLARLATKPGAPFLALHKLGVVPHASNPGIQKAKA